MSTVKTPENSLPPVCTREDCFSWVTETELQDELWAAYRAAVRHYRTHDFGAELAEFLAGDSEVDGLIPDTVLRQSDSRPWVNRSSFWDTLVHLVVWRILALGESKGVFTDSSNMMDLPPGCSTASEVFEHPYWGPVLGGLVQTLTFDSEQAMQAFMQANSIKKKAPAGVASTTEAMTTVKRTNDDGTNCRG